MLTSRTACIHELDDPLLAAEEIGAQLNLDSLSKNSLGILFCDQEFVDNGIVKRVCQALPFETIGTVTPFTAVPGMADSLQLAVMVLTSDTVAFSTSRSDRYRSDQHRQTILNLRDAAFATLDGPPDLALAFGTMVYNDTLDDATVVATLGEALGNTPLFGTLGCNHREGEYLQTTVIHNGDSFTDRLVLGLLQGPFTARFSLSGTPENRSHRQNAVVTKSRGHLLEEVNDRPVTEYLDSLGLILDGQMVGCHSYPFILERPGQDAVSRTIYGLTPEGSVHCGGEMWEGASISIGAQDVAAVLHATGKVLHDARSLADVKAAFLFSCHSRCVTLGLDETAEAALVEEELGGRVPYIFMYSGGEICPRHCPDGTMRNAFHNDTIVACFLQEDGA